MSEGTAWLVTGATGQLGTELQRVLAGQDVTALGRAQLDLTDETRVRGVVSRWRDDAVARGARPVRAMQISR